MATFFVTATGSEGDVSPLAEIARSLAVRGHEALLFTNRYFAERFDVAPATTVSIETAAAYENFLALGEMLNNPRTVPLVFKSYFLPRAALEFNALSSAAGQRKPIVIANETPGIGARLFAESYGLRIARVLTYPSHVESAPLFLNMVETQLNGEFANLRDRCNLPSCASIAHWWHRSPYRIALWPDWFQKVTDSEIVQAGFVSWSGEARDTACPDTHPNAGIRASIVITGGTGYFAGAEFFRVSSEACIQLGKVCLIVCRNRALLDAALPPSIQHVLWAPSLAGLISQSELIIHHGGMGIIGLSVMAGIPQLCLAAGGDRPRNARIVKELGLGDYLVRSEWSSTAVAAMIKSLGANSYRVRCKYRSQQTDRLDAINRAVAFFEAISCS